MATYYVWSGASGTNAGTSWTNAYTSFASAVTAATVDGDVILVHYTHQQNVSAATTYTFQASIRVISVNKDSSNSPTAMGTGGWIGHNSSSWALTLDITSANEKHVYIYGMTFRTAGTTAASINILTNTDAANLIADSCYFWIGTTSASSLVFGRSNLNSSNIHILLINCTLRFASTTNQSCNMQSAFVELQSCTVSSSGSVPITLFSDGSTGGAVTAIACDLSHVTTTLVGVHNDGPRPYSFSQCKLGSNVTILTANIGTAKCYASVWLFDCASGDTHGLFGYYDGNGSCVSDTGIYYTTGAASQSWKIVTSSYVSFYNPFFTPCIDLYNTSTTSITPFFELLRDGSTTAYQDNQVWGEFFVKKDSGSTQSTPYNDRMTLLGTPANQAAGAGTGSWMGEAASAWSGKIDSGSAVTPAENGHIRGRLVVGEPSITVYLDPQIRT